ncbi:STAS domain-containing protein [Sediminibacillus albus]|nr:STAS domain-containing protein [Sediminibacillus albus]
MEQIHKLAFFQNQLEENVPQLAEELLQNLLEKFPETYTNLSEEDHHLSYKLISALITTLSSLLPESEHADQEAIRWGQKIGSYLVDRDNSLSDSLAKLSVHKRVLWLFIEKKARTSDFGFHEVIEVMTRIDELYNHIVHGVGITLKEEEERKLSTYEEKYLKVSTPLVPIMDAVAVLPIIGEIDERRAEVLLEETVHRASQLNIDWLVIDLSGIFKVDDLFVSYLYKLLDLLKLLGITPILTGMKPEMSIRSRELGLFKEKGIITKSHLKQAVEMLHAQMK